MLLLLTSVLGWSSKYRIHVWYMQHCSMVYLPTYYHTWILSGQISSRPHRSDVSPKWWFIVREIPVYFRVSPRWRASITHRFHHLNSWIASFGVDPTKNSGKNAAHVDQPTWALRWKMTFFLKEIRLQMVGIFHCHSLVFGGCIQWRTLSRCIPALNMVIF